MTMTSESIAIPAKALGSDLREARLAKSLDLTFIAEETKISLNNLKAMEAGDYNKLPAEVFARGFYKLYAQTLSLDPETILQRYQAEKIGHPEPHGAPSPRTAVHNPEVGSLAEPYSNMPFSSFGLLIFVLLTFGAFLCWYFSWNPASFLSQKLRSLQQNSKQLEQVQTESYLPDKLPLLSGLFPLRSATAATHEQVTTYKGNLKIIIVDSVAKNSKNSILQKNDPRPALDSSKPKP